VAERDPKHNDRAEAANEYLPAVAAAAGGGAPAAEVRRMPSPRAISRPPVMAGGRGMRMRCAALTGHVAYA
jgi:hypothetical protein